MLINFFLTLCCLLSFFFLFFGIPADLLHQAYLLGVDSFIAAFLCILDYNPSQDKSD